MIKFLLNFIGYGILFYVIYLFFPEAFKTLVSWADKIYEFFNGVLLETSEKIRHQESSNSLQSAFDTLKSFFYI